MESLLDPEQNELSNKSGSVYVVSESGKSFVTFFFYQRSPKSDRITLISFLCVRKERKRLEATKNSLGRIEPNPSKSVP